MQIIALCVGDDNIDERSEIPTARGAVNSMFSVQVCGSGSDAGKCGQLLSHSQD